MDLTGLYILPTGLSTLFCVQEKFITDASIGYITLQFGVGGSEVSDFVASLA
jgi:hypothetical protein